MLLRAADPFAAPDDTGVWTSSEPIAEVHGMLNIPDREVSAFADFEGAELVL